MRCRDGDVAGPGRLSADVEHVRALGGHAGALRDGSLDVVAEPVAAERVGRDVDDAHDIRARAPLELSAPDFGDHDAIMLGEEMRLEDLARGAGAVLEGNPDVEITGIAYDSRRVAPND